ncbi:MAG TPA: type II toxin-antitoxin system death-on-curing family toxin [Geminicoccus sp.]|uniref:type II toxin-antitoxin system death-on-curing family toxin n=1 Tax=Geminicoccus sp. TaxID=2024832 RepID=UPI002CBDC237|nr:type II toxin-antitoxin system death-on-curing family toxin [Geminicoccus sp.]HWL71210.1 type II toxin-antitoxin system death-on-curing family toxin [Geminicoccus sp.]
MIESDPYRDKKTLGVSDVVHAHFVLADFFDDIGEGMSTPGLRSIDLLQSAVARQVVGMGGGILKYQDNCDIAATLFYGIVKNHAFIDANKRTALLCLILHLQRFRRRLSISMHSLEEFTVDVAESKSLGEGGDVSLDQDAYVFNIGKFIRENSVKCDRISPTITYRQLETILFGFGYCIDNSKSNFADIRDIKSGKRMCQIAFPSWAKQVPRNTIVEIRKRCSLNYINSVTDEEFFKGIRDADILTAKYQEPLRRLADR